MTDGGKGSAPRPIPNYKQYESNWDLIFKKEKKNDDTDTSVHSDTVDGVRTGQPTEGVRNEG